MKPLSEPLVLVNALQQKASSITTLILQVVFLSDLFFLINTHTHTKSELWIMLRTHTFRTLYGWQWKCAFGSALITPLQWNVECSKVHWLPVAHVGWTSWETFVFSNDYCHQNLILEFFSLLLWHFLWLTGRNKYTYQQSWDKSILKTL